MSEIERDNRPESGFFADYHNVRQSVAALREVDGLRPEEQAQWDKMSTEQRLKALQQAEDRLAQAQGRPACKVRGEHMNANEYGYFHRNCIYVNTNPQLFNNRAETVNTLVHEGRHAYQSHAIRNRGFHPENRNVPGHDDNRQWKANYRAYKTNEKHGPAAYARQPVEHDAGGFGFAVTKGLYPDYRPGPDRIDQYNARTAEAKYKLKLAPESLQSASYLPANKSHLTKSNRRGQNVQQATETKRHRLASQRPARATTSQSAAAPAKSAKAQPAKAQPAKQAQKPAGRTKTMRK